MPTTTYPTPDPVSVFLLALAIANAEGAFRKDSRPARNHNPGDLTLDIGGNSATAIGHDGTFMVYANDRDGFVDLHQLCFLMLSGRSKYYKPTDTLVQVAEKYTSTQQTAWARNVAAFLNVPTSTRLCDIR